MMATFDPGFTTTDMAAAFSPRAHVQAMCRFEAALAAASAEAGLVDPAVADEIAAACEAGPDDAEALLVDGWEVGTPVLPLLEHVRRDLSDVAAAALHHGATTQDVVDTATMLQVGEGIGLLRGGLVSLARDLAALADEHRATPATGWTLLQPAVPVTVGLRAARWLAPVVDHAASLRNLAGARPVQLGGPSGTLDALGEDALAVRDGVARRLGLATPLVPWHTDRTPVSRVAGVLARTARTTASIGSDLSLLAHDGRVAMRSGGSSSMPAKRNPVDAVRAVAAADACLGTTAIVTGGRPQELERGVGGWHAEWFAVPLAFQACAASVEAIGRAVDTLTIVPEEDVDGGVTPATEAFIDRVLTACEEELAR